MNSSLLDRSKITSIGARASEQPRTRANGVCTGAWPGTKENPSESGLDGITTGPPASPLITSAWTRATISS